ELFGTNSPEKHTTRATGNATNVTSGHCGDDHQQRCGRATGEPERHDHCRYGKRCGDYPREQLFQPVLCGWAIPSVPRMTQEWHLADEAFLYSIGVTVSALPLGAESTATSATSTNPNATSSSAPGRSPRITLPASTPTTGTGRDDREATGTR